MEKNAKIYDFFRFLAITLGCLIGGLYIPILGIVLIVLTPSPTILLVFRQGWKMGFLLTLTLVVLLSLASSLVYGVVYFVLFGGGGLILAYCFDRGYSKEKALIVCSAGNVFIAMAFFLMVALFTGVSINELITIQINRNISESIKLYETMKLGKEQIQVLRQSAETFKIFFLNAYAGLYGAFCIIFILCNYLFSRKVLSRLGIIVSDASPFTELSFPDIWVWGAIIGGVLWASGIDPLYILGINCSVLFITVYGMQGLSILFFYTDKTRLSRVSKGILLFLFAMQPLFIFLVSGVGVFDTWFDFRKLKQNDLLNKLTS